MDQKELEYLRRIEDHADQTGGVVPPTQEDKDYLAYLRQVSERYNINLSKANRLEYDFVARVAESEFYLQRANTEQFLQLPNQISANRRKNISPASGKTL